MSTITARNIAKMAVDAAFELLEKNGLGQEEKALPDLLIQEANARRKRLLVTVTTPEGKAGALLDTIRSALEQKHGVPVEVIEKADPTMLGGVVIEYGDERIDHSVRRSLDQVGQTLNPA